MSRWLMAGAVGLMLAFVCAEATATTRAASPEVVRLTFTQQGPAYSVVADGGRYVFLNDKFSGQGPGSPPTYFFGGTLVDEQTGHTISITRPGCRGYLVGGPWLLLKCGYGPSTSYLLYSIPNHKVWRQIPATGSGSTATYPVAIGRDWIQYQTPETGEYVFQNIAAERMRTLAVWRPGGRVIPDLDSPSLVQELCRPLQVPYAYWTNGKVDPGIVTPVADAAVLVGTRVSRPGYAPYIVSNVQRCGSRVKHQSLATYSANSNAILAGGDYNRSLGGWALPRLKAITIPVPTYYEGFYAPYQLALSSRNAYLVDSAYQVWVARFPAVAR